MCGLMVLWDVEGRSQIRYDEEENEQAARVLFLLVPFALSELAPVPFRLMRGCLALPRSWSMWLSQSDLFGMNENSRSGSQFVMA